MSELTLTRDERLALRARAHHLNPVVLLGAAGLTEAVLKETDRALTAHELIKVRIPSDEREAREMICTRIASELNAARVQVIGKLLVLYRPRPVEEEQSPRVAAPTRPRKPQQPARSPAATAGATPKARSKARVSGAVRRRSSSR